MTTAPIFERLALIGCGLIGSSIARAAKAEGAARFITAWDQSADVRARAESLDLCQIADSPHEAVAGADCVILATPVGALSDAAAAIAPHLAPGAVLTDVGSVKEAAIAAIAPHAPAHVFFVPGHPIAGTERSGPEAGFAHLFHGRWHILTPLPDPRPDYSDAVERLAQFWQALGAQVERMEPRRHDLVLAITSHLPHLIAYSIVATASDLERVTRSEVVKFSAGGFRDFTRIAASDPVMWRDVFLNNKEAVLEMLARFSEDLASLQRAIRWDEGDQLHKLFSRAREVRRAIIDAGQDTPFADFGRNKP